MKYLKRFNEAILEWETDNIKSFYQELEDKIENLTHLSFEDLKQSGEKNDVEVVDYDTFIFIPNFSSNSLLNLVSKISHLLPSSITSLQLLCQCQEKTPS